MGHVSMWARGDSAEEGALACGSDWAMAGNKHVQSRATVGSRGSRLRAGAEGGVQESSPRPPPSKADG